MRKVPEDQAEFLGVFLGRRSRLQRLAKRRQLIEVGSVRASNPHLSSKRVPTRPSQYHAVVSKYLFMHRTQGA